jgi:hypothetical protein
MESALNLRSCLKSWAISRTSRWNGNLRINKSADFWYLLISLRATVPGRYRWGFLTPPVAGAVFLAALVASCLRGALPPVDLRAVCFVQAMVMEGMLVYGMKGSSRKVLNGHQRWFMVLSSVSDWPMRSFCALVSSFMCSVSREWGCDLLYGTYLLLCRLHKLY